MAKFNSFAVYNSDGTPRPNGTPAFISYRDRAGVARVVPTIYNLGGGAYGFMATTGDLAAGTGYHILDGVGVEKRYLSGFMGQDFHGLALYGSVSGDPFTTATPAFATYVNTQGTPLAQPPITHLGEGLYGFTTPAAHMAAGAAYEINAGAGVLPARLYGTVDLFESIDASINPTVTLQVIRGELIVNAAVIALVVDRIFPQYMPQATVMPAIVLSLISEIPITSFDGAANTRLSHARVQIDCYATTYLKAHEVANAVDAVVANLSRFDLSAYRDNKQDLYEDETQLHRVSMDYMVSL